MSSEINEIVNTLKNADNEGTESPFWLLIDPTDIHGYFEDVAERGEVPDFDSILSMIASAIEGPFFSREDAETYLKNRHYAYSTEAKVWCASGCLSKKYKALCRSLRIGQSNDLR